MRHTSVIQRSHLAAVGAMQGIVFLLLAFGAALGASAQQTIFSYQGRLLENALPVEGQFDLRFGLFTDAVGDALADLPLVLGNQSVRGGVFEVSLDFGADFVSTGEQWLEIALRRVGDERFVILSPRQRLSSSPIALIADAAAADAASSEAVIDGSVGTGDIAIGTISDQEIAANAVTSQHLAAQSVSSSKLQSGAVGRDQLAINSVSRAKIQPNAVDAGKIADDAVNALALTPSAVGSEEIGNDAVGAQQVASDAVRTNHIANGAVGAEEIRTGAVRRININSSQVQARVDGRCSAGSSIRRVDTNGNVTCESDGEGLVSFNNPITYSASSINGAGLQETAMELVSTHVCLLSEVDTRDTDNGAEFATCRMAIDGGRWKLAANTFPGRDADAFCQALCLVLVTSP